MSTLGFRFAMIRMGLEAELKGFRLTSRAPRCFKIIADEFGIKAKRNADGKRVAYLEYCARFGFTPKPEHVKEGDPTMFARSEPKPARVNAPGGEA